MPGATLPKEAAFSIFNVLVGLGYGCALKHLRGGFQVEVPVRLRGDKAYNKESEITALAVRAGYNAIQTGNTLRIVA